MIELDPIIAVKDVENSSKWYQNIFGLRSMHGGGEFDVLVNKNNEVIICLHKIDLHDHPTMQSKNIKIGNGLILYFRMANMAQIRKRLGSINYNVEKEIALNTNSRRKEFSLKDPDGYYLIVSEFHTYEG